ncbi:helix-turn-helix transcriptional regulator [Brevibacillus aydinogluensis]|uniref:helix-turn-helix transcriptional regulator n=1 Tax=Brevibacillus aydinogluensis TaxID=927786 RepID=UPI0034C6412F
MVLWQQYLQIMVIYCLGGVPMSFAEMVKEYRYKANLSISELAELTGLNRSVLARIESGETRRPSFSTCCKIASALDIPYDKIISFYLGVSERPETLKCCCPRLSSVPIDTLSEKRLTSCWKRRG